MSWYAYQQGFRPNLISSVSILISMQAVLLSLGVYRENGRAYALYAFSKILCEVAMLQLRNEVHDLADSAERPLLEAA